MNYQQAHENAKTKVGQLVKELEKKSQAYSKKTGGNGKVRYAYVAGALEIDLIDALAEIQQLKHPEQS